ncbi:MAG: hypothetical protein J3K34DRAFT_441113, partial [Monoraphidium minutum]
MHTRGAAESMGLELPPLELDHTLDLSDETCASSPTDSHELGALDAAAISPLSDAARPAAAAALEARLQQERAREWKVLAAEGGGGGGGGGAAVAAALKDELVAGAGLRPLAVALAARRSGAGTPLGGGTPRAPAAGGGAGSPLSGGTPRGAAAAAAAAAAAPGDASLWEEAMEASRMDYAEQVNVLLEERDTLVDRLLDTTRALHAAEARQREGAAAHAQVAALMGQLQELLRRAEAERDRAQWALRQQARAAQRMSGGGAGSAVAAAVAAAEAGALGGGKRAGGGAVELVASAAAPASAAPAAAPPPPPPQRPRRRRGGLRWWHGAALAGAAFLFGATCFCVERVVVPPPAAALEAHVAELEAAASFAQAHRTPSPLGGGQCGIQGRGERGIRGGRHPGAGWG